MPQFSLTSTQAEIIEYLLKSEAVRPGVPVNPNNRRHLQAITALYGRGYVRIMKGGKPIHQPYCACAPRDELKFIEAGYQSITPAEVF